jgi:hypothetical protein
VLKKTLLVALACIGGYFAYKKTQQDKVDEEVWGEAVDQV